MQPAMQPARPRRGRKSSAKLAAPVNAYGSQIFEFCGVSQDFGPSGGGNGGLSSQSLSTVGHGGDVDGSTRTQHARTLHTRTENEIDDDEDKDAICGLFQGSDFTNVLANVLKTRMMTAEGGGATMKRVAKEIHTSQG